MKIYLIALMLLIGFVLTLHLAMNAQVGAILKNPRMGNAIFWAIGACTAIIIGATDWDPTVFGRLKYKYVESYYYIKLKNGNYITKDKNYISRI